MQKCNPKEQPPKVAKHMPPNIIWLSSEISRFTILQLTIVLNTK